MTTITHRGLTFTFGCTGSTCRDCPRPAVVTVTDARGILSQCVDHAYSALHGQEVAA